MLDAAAFAGSLGGMAGESEETGSSAAGRLEQALERIARLAGRGGAPASAGMTGAGTEEIASRLDVMIERLRAALNGKPER